MHNFNPADFVALSPAKAKAAALALFTDAHASPAPDWYGVALALHAVVNRAPAKRAKAGDDIAMQDDADASEFIAWADYQPTGKATAIARGRVSICFADGWSVTVGMLASKTAKGRKPWSIAHAVRFAVICYEAAAIRRATGDDAALYHQRDGLSFPLNGLIDVPEIMSIISADSAETVEGDLVWSACEANGFTRERRAGAVAVPLALEPMRPGLEMEIKARRWELIDAMGLIRNPMRDAAKAAAARVVALLYPAPDMDVHGYAADCEPEAVEPVALEEDAAHAPADDEPGLFADASDDEPAGEEIAVVEREPADHETMLAANDIIGGILFIDPFSSSLSLAFHERFPLVEDALLAWPAQAEPCAAINGEPVELVEEPAMGIPMTEAVPARKPRYSVGADGKWVLIG